MDSVKLSWLGACVVIDTGDRVCAVDPADILAVYGANRGVTLFLMRGEPVHIGMSGPRDPAQVVRDLLAFIGEGPPDNGDDDVADIECAVQLRVELDMLWDVSSRDACKLTTRAEEAETRAEAAVYSASQLIVERAAAETRADAAEARGARLDVYIAKLEREEETTREWQTRARNAADTWRNRALAAEARAKDAETESARDRDNVKVNNGIYERDHAAWTAECATLRVAVDAWHRRAFAAEKRVAEIALDAMGAKK